MHPDKPLDLVGGLPPSKFMREYWQRKPLLIKQACPNFRPPLGGPALKKMSRRDEVESRLGWKEKKTWQMERGPFPRLAQAVRTELGATRTKR